MSLAYTINIHNINGIRIDTAHFKGGAWLQLRLETADGDYQDIALFTDGDIPPIVVADDVEVLRQSEADADADAILAEPESDAEFEGAAAAYVDASEPADYGYHNRRSEPADYDDRR